MFLVICVRFNHIRDYVIRHVAITKETIETNITAQ